MIMREKQNSGSDFFELVYEITKMIPSGRVTSYGAIARCLGSGRSARMVGWAMNNSHTQPGNIPAHRVVNHKGLLTGRHHFGDPDMMQKLLEEEGIIVIDNMVADFDKKFWDPATELA